MRPVGGRQYNARMVRKWRLLKTRAARGAWNMAVDEAVLESVGRGESDPTLRLYAWEPACLSLGRAQQFADVDLERLRARGWDVVRRATGGRAILHVDELTYSIEAAAAEEPVSGPLLESYNRLARGLLRAVRQLGIPAEMKPGTSGSGRAWDPVCFDVPSAYEITVQGKKLIGSAQARRKEGVLQHGSLPLTGDLRRITEALTYAEESERADAGSRLLDRATTVEATLERSISWEEAAQAIAMGFEEELGLSFHEGSLSIGEQQRAVDLVQKKYGHPMWTERV